MGTTLTRALSGAVYVALLITVTLYSSSSFLFLFGFFSIIATIEFCKLVGINKVVGTVLNVAIFYLFNYTNYLVSIENIALAFSLFISISLLLFLFKTKNTISSSFLNYVFLIGYIILSFVWLTKLPLLTATYEPKIVIALFAIIWCNDTFAYITGISFGRTKLFEKVSPKKTVEGFIGGFIFSLLIGYFIAVYWLDDAVALWLFLSVIISFFGTLGDLIESKFKRIASVKDSGTLMPGHGGVLDRLDSIIFVAPILIFTFKIIAYVS
jgi:phosphatidate cytidylyltransferase